MRTCSQRITSISKSKGIDNSEGKNLVALLVLSMSGNEEVPARLVNDLSCKKPTDKQGQV